jgi:hypothetical protein
VPGIGSWAGAEATSEGADKPQTEGDWRGERPGVGGGAPSAAAPLHLSGQCR